MEEFSHGLSLDNRHVDVVVTKNRNGYITWVRKATKDEVEKLCKEDL